MNPSRNGSPSAARGVSRLHRLVGLLTGVIVLVVVITGVLLQYPHLLGRRPVEATTFAVDPRTPGRWLRGTSEGVEVSEDDGRSWREAPMLMPPGEVRRILFAPDDLQRVWVLGRDALLTSTDGGRIWERIHPSTPPEHAWRVFRDLDVGPGGRIAVITQAGVVRSPNDGDSWTPTAWPRPEAGNVHQLVHDLHTGWILGSTGGHIVTITAIGLVVLTLSGFLLAALRGRPRNDDRR